MLADPRLTTMLRDLAALQVLATGLRGVHRDPREEAGRTTGGRRAPEVTELERAVDTGDLARARVVSRVFARTPPALHAALVRAAAREGVRVREVEAVEMLEAMREVRSV